jgi:hypothetical protein
VNADHPKQCSLDLDNYMECLHHKKEVFSSAGGHLVDIEIESAADKRGMGQAAEGGSPSPDRETGVQRRGVKEDCVEIGIHRWICQTE